MIDLTLYAKNYPKACALAEGSINLFNFFDEHNIFVIPDKEMDLWMVEVQQGIQTAFCDFAKDRSDAESKGFNKAFELLENQL